MTLPAKPSYEVRAMRPRLWVWKRATEELGASDRTVFVYGNVIYNPGGGTLDGPLLAHELVHIAQQRALGGGDPETGARAWWERYFEDPPFRYAQELAAYQKQYQVFCAAAPYRGPRLRFLDRIAIDLAGPLYGSIVTVEQAVQAIRGG